MIIIIDNELAKSIGYQIKKYNMNQFSKEELESVNEISLRNMNFRGEFLNIDLEQLKDLPYLENLYLQGFIIDDDVIEIINELKELKNIYFSQCSIKNNKKFIMQKLKHLILKFCEGTYYNFFDSLECLSIQTKIDETFDLSEINNKFNIKQLYINNANIINFEIINEFNNLKFLNIDGSKVDKENVLDTINKTIEISHQSNYLPIN